MTHLATATESLARVNTPAGLAELFCEWDDDAQAKFFVEVARIMQGYPLPGRAMQAWFIGRHLRECDCSTEEARFLLTDIYCAMTDDEAPNHEVAL